MKTAEIRMGDLVQTIDIPKTGVGVSGGKLQLEIALGKTRVPLGGGETDLVIVLSPTNGVVFRLPQQLRCS